MKLRRGVYPGSFNPPTTAHLAIIDAAIEQLALDRLDLAISRVALAKGVIDVPTFDDRVAVIEASTAYDDRVGVVVTDRQLIADIAEGYDVVVMGADKWEQVNDPQFYDSIAERDNAVQSLPELAIAPRPPTAVSSERQLDLGDSHGPTSSSRARAGAFDLMTPAARDFDRATGAWTDPSRYLESRADSNDS